MENGATPMREFQVIGRSIRKVDSLALSRGEDRFTAEYCQSSGRRWVLAQGENGYCVFWDDLCTIHPVKPKMCRQWPFIQSVLVDTNNWHIMAALCPGIRTDIPDSVIRQCVADALSADSDPSVAGEGDG